MMNIFSFFHKKNSFPITFFIVSTLIISCASQITTGTNTIKRYCVGEGGGFTGEYVEFSFSEDGKVYKRDINNQRDVFFKQLKESDLYYLLEKFNRLGISTLDISHPGNISYYFEIREGETSFNKVTWGERNYYPPNNIVEFHQEMLKKLSALE